MSLRLRSIEVENFRKFRAPLSITGLTDGLNIIIEANEIGKSTLLEALRAAFFVRHSTKSQLAQSYAPYGDSVAPRIQVAFEIDGVGWSLSKQFLKNSSIEVRGPRGRTQGDEAEALLQELLGFERDSSRAGDTAAHGTLGLLWVAQAEALAVTAPGHIVRDTVLSTLEAEVGTIMGGATYDRVRARIEEQFNIYWTATGRATGRQTAAKERLDHAKTAKDSADLRLAMLEKTFNDLEMQRARLKVIDREIADNTDQEAMAKLVKDSQIARAAAQVLATRTAEHDALSTRVRGLEELQERHQNATNALKDSEEALKEARDARAALADELRDARERQSQARESVASARERRKLAREALKTGESLEASHRRRKAIDAARERHSKLLALEKRIEETEEIALQFIAPETISELEKLERAVTTAQVAVTIGATRIELVGPNEGILIDGRAFPVGELTITAETKISLPSSAELIVRPPATAANAAAELEDAIEAEREALEELGIRDLTAGRARNDAAKAAVGEIRTIEAQISALTPSDDELGIEAGASALKLFISELGEEPAVESNGALPDLQQLAEAVDAAESELAKAEGVFQSCLDTLREVEGRDTPLATAEAGAQRDLENAKTQLQTIEQHVEFTDLATRLQEAREAAAEAALNLEDAKRDAAVHDEDEINRKIKVIDARIKATSESKRALETDIARLEATVENEGGKGLADHAAAAKEEFEAAAAALERVTQEAEALKMLRQSLEEARIETSQTFLGPVARRAKRHIERLLPGCDLTFSENLSLESIVRAGVSEGCDNLSKGTQEQLAVLTRLAFADMLLEEGRPVSLILDDPLVYSDDGRLDLMTEILIDASHRMQILLLTCRERAFRHVPGNRVAISGASELAA